MSMALLDYHQQVIIISIIEVITEKMLKMLSRRAVTSFIGALLLMSSNVALASLSQGFATSGTIATGSLVSLDSKVSGSVVATDVTNASRLFGVAVPPTSASISLSAGSSPGQVQVATSGTATVLVSTGNGAIKVGDFIAASTIAGVGQKASGSVRVIGTAQADFDGTGENTTKRTIEIEGKSTEVTIGQIPIEISISTYSKDDNQSFKIPSWAQGLSNTLAGKNVNPIRILIAGLVLLVAIISITVLLYSAVRNSIISIGRNPLSKRSVLAGLFQVLLISFGILIAAVVVIYFVISR
jgi:hypothetical protein